MPTQEWEEFTARTGYRGRRRVLPRVRLRIGSDARRNPIWLEMPFVLDRPLPPEAEVTGAQIVRTRVGVHWRYRLCITTRLPDPAPAPATLPRIAVDIGWRRMEDGTLRVGYAVAENGWSMDIRCPERTITDIARVEEVRAGRDRDFAAAQDRLATWIEAQPTLPEWFRARTRTLRRWRSPAALRRLCEDWREQPFDGDAEAWGALEQWRERYDAEYVHPDGRRGRSDGDLHHLAREAHLRDQALAHRNETYRAVATEIARRASCVVIERFDLRAITRRPAPEQEGASTTFRRAERTAAPGVLRTYIRQACAAHGVPVVEVAAAYTSLEHHRCGLQVEQECAAATMFYCPDCDEWYDRDDNAARNLLRRASEGGSAEKVGVARTLEGLTAATAKMVRGAWQRRKAASKGGSERGRSQSGAGAHGAEALAE
jgi:hypothetical protein